MRQDSKVPLEVGNGIDMHGCSNISFWSWDATKGIMSTIIYKCRWYWSAYFSYRWIHFSRSLFFSSTSIPLSPLMSRHTIHPALVQSTGPSICSIFVASLIYPNTSIFTNFLQNLPFYLRRIKWVSVAELMVLYVILGIGWVAKLLEGRMIRLIKYGLIYWVRRMNYC